MKIESAAGEFEFSIEAMNLSGDNIMLTGKMGVWEAETSMSRDEALQMVRLAFASPGLWPFLVKLPFYAMFGKRSNSKNKTDEGEEL